MTKGLPGSAVFPALVIGGAGSGVLCEGGKERRYGVKETLGYF